MELNIAATLPLHFPWACLSHMAGQYGTSPHGLSKQLKVPANAHSGIASRS
jgi:hypothetical protein